jgi:nitrogen regulatory protein P-II 1
MKKVEAILSSHRLDQIKAALFHRGCQELLVSDVRLPCSRLMKYRGLSYEADAPRIKIEVIVPDADAVATVDAILQNVAAGGAQDERVSVAHVEELISIGESMALMDTAKSREIDAPATARPFISPHRRLRAAIH